MNILLQLIILLFRREGTLKRYMINVRYWLLLISKWNCQLVALTCGYNLDRKGCFLDNTKNGLVVRKDIGCEAFYPALLLSDTDQHMKHEGGDSPSPVVIIDNEGQIGIGFVLHDFVAGLGDDSLRTGNFDYAYYGHGRPVVHVYIRLHFPMGHGFNGVKVAIVDRLVRKTIEEPPHLLLVGGLDCPEMDR